MPHIRSKKAGQYLKQYTDTFDQRDELNNLLETIKYPHYKITPKAQRPIKVVLNGLPRYTNTEDIKRHHRRHHDGLYCREEGFESKMATQCFQCNQFNHTAENCHLIPRCLKCGEEHQTRNCQIKRVDTPYCINCKTYGHMANYSKCPLFPKPRKGTALKTNYTNTVNSIVRPNTSYAQITKNSLHSANPQHMSPLDTNMAHISQRNPQEITPGTHSNSQY
ncbi:putative RNA-directed DNA polymerase from transposon X-element [Trichonephila clavipes]|nr:putative RNA-directed DNA polymerase from transposon X-element [Trichonephila clavipes]